MTEIATASPAVRAIGLALIWFLPQGALVGVAVAALLAALRRATADLRYVVGCAGLVAMVVWPVLTAAHFWTRGPVAAVAAASVPAGPAVSAARPTPPVVGPGWRARLAPDRVAPLAVAGWIAGMLMLTGRLVGGWLQVTRIRRHARPPQLAAWGESLARLAGQLRIRRAVRLLESTRVGVPIVIGWLRPVVLIPAGVFAGLTPDQIDAILAHELAHVRRGDYLVNTLQRVVEIALFYHPAVWWISACVRREREYCCDDLAAPLSQSRQAYARALLALEEHRGHAPALAMAATGTGLFARVRRIVEPSSPESTFPKGAAVTIISSVVILLLVSFRGTGHAAAPAAVDTRAADPRAAIVTDLGAPTRPMLRAAGPDGPATRWQGTAEPRGAIQGTVTDQANDRVPGAAVTLDAIGRVAPTRTAMTNATGQFELTGVADGSYLLTIKLSGFRADERRVDLTAGSTVTARVQLKLGLVAESVRVSSAAEVPPAPPQASAAASVARLLDAAKQATDAGHLADAEASVRAALAILHTAQPGAPASSGVIRVGGDIKEPKKIQDVRPIYPAAAKDAGIQGVVLLDATINSDGTVADARVIQGVPELTEAALQAVRQWVYTPTLLDGVPVEVNMTVSIVFSLR